MAKEVDLKKIELKVSVNCCDGCKKKVKKLLRSVEGVLKTEIDSQQPKVTVVGNVSPQTLIKKLLKAGKQAEMWSHENAGGKEKKEVVTATKEKEISKSGGCESTCGTIITDKSKEFRINNGEDGGGKQASTKDITSSTSCSHKEIKNGNALIPNNPQLCNVNTHTQYCYMVEPRTITLPYYAIVPPPCYNQQLYYERPQLPPPPPPPLQAPTNRVGDYFSDENTIGCYVM